ncbi:phage major tail tube protein [Bosea minatitlanensis]|uniref:Phage major tail tube protein n=1 Tax=Bosea minatitlanensis TaxID=128782 RepID=A0ABW0F207_9HYPH|nr:phage major tail tube protein [Bosea minatitlanensis]MCT4491815.1 phage major tail tube protein [Bosea minatitlanensis]
MSKIAFLPIRGMNWYAEDAAGQPLNLHLATESSKLPAMAESFETFVPAASNGAIEIALNREACEASLKLKGLQPEVLKLFSTPFGVRRKFTGFGVLVNEYAASANERLLQVTATIHGRIGAEIEEHNGTSLTGTDYTIKSVSKYQLTIGNEEIARFNIELGGWMDKEGQQVQIANMLGLAG